MVAEQFGTLEALHPGRIDLGIGRAPGTDQATARALRRSADGPAADGLRPRSSRNCGPTSRDRACRRSPDRRSGRSRPRATSPPCGCSGPAATAPSSPALGLPFAFAHHFSAASAVNARPALALYRKTFTPSRRPRRAVQPDQRVGAVRRRRRDGALAARIVPAGGAAPRGRASRPAAEPGGGRGRRVHDRRADGNRGSNNRARRRRPRHGDRRAGPARQQHRRRRADGDDQHLRPRRPARQLRAARPGGGPHPAPGEHRAHRPSARRSRPGSWTDPPSRRSRSARGSRRRSADSHGWFTGSGDTDWTLSAEQMSAGS